MNNYFKTSLFLLIAILIGNGCTSYQLGSTLPKGLRTINVPIFTNKTDEPLLETIATQKTLEEFQREGTMKIEKADADTILEVTLDNYVIEPLRYSKKESLTGKEYRIRIYATMTFSKAKPEKTVLLRKKVIGEATFEMTGDLASSKRTATPQAAENLGYHIVNNIVEYW